MIGVLALQGAFQKHLECLQKLNISCRLVRAAHELEGCLGLILPGGETTTHFKLLQGKFWDQLKAFGKKKPIFGTCCGLILLSKEIVNDPLKPLGLMDISVTRNAYGTQTDSFQEVVEVQLDDEKVPVDCFFIRAPKITRTEPSVKVLSRYQGEPVVVTQNGHLACSFHPELAMDLQLHSFFARQCLQKSLL